MAFGVAWYRPEQWELLRAVSAEPDNLPPTHAQWLPAANERFRELTSRGFDVRQVDVDVHELADWCRKNQRAVDGAARSQFAAEKLREAA
jgi:hypothetical protein